MDDKHCVAIRVQKLAVDTEPWRSLTQVQATVCFVQSDKQQKMVMHRGGYVVWTADLAEGLMHRRPY
jgi:hypothetical protein